MEEFLEKITLEIPPTQDDSQKCGGGQKIMEQSPPRIFQSRKRNFNEILFEDRISKKVHGMPGVRLQQEIFQLRAYDPKLRIFKNFSKDFVGIFYESV